MKKLMILCISLALVGCATNPDGTLKSKTGAGAGIGAAAGAAIGTIFAKKGSKTKGTLIGAGVGGLLGGGIGLILDKRKKELEEVAQTEVTPEGQLKTKIKGDITFATNSSSINYEGTEKIRKLAAILSKYPNDSIEITGHTDSQGTASWNQQLSSQRAESVRAMLVNNGVRAPITTAGFGPSLPVADNTTSTGRAQNRRVEINIEVAEVAAEKAKM